MHLSMAALSGLGLYSLLLPWGNFQSTHKSEEKQQGNEAEI